MANFVGVLERTSKDILEENLHREGTPQSTFPSSLVL